MESKVSFFLGANTPSGFYSLYDQMLEPGTARRIYLLKGGPGCGKSSLMCRVAQALEAGGEQVEYIFCSGDPNSLDAVIFPRLRSAVVDATAPHAGVQKSTAARQRGLRHVPLWPESRFSSRTPCADRMCGY